MPLGIASDGKIGNYVVGGKLGEGTFGTVLKATHQISGERVAVKVLEKQRMKQADDIERVGREIQILKQLKHPHVVRLWEIIHAPHGIYLVMEFAPKGELFQYIVKQGRLREEEARGFFNQIVAGVAYLHAMHVVHRDIKPENLLLDNERTIRIVDFGLSTKCAPGQVLKHACGSPCYAAPEMLTREGQQHGYVGHPVDVWSTGVTLFAMICGFLPFEHANTSALYKKIIAGEYAAPPFLSRDAKDLIKRLLTTDPRRRWNLDQIAAHAWCTADGANSAVVHVGSEGGAVAQLASELAPDQATLERMEQQYGYDARAVEAELGKHSEAAATYWLLRLRALKSEGKHAAAAGGIPGGGASARGGGFRQAMQPRPPSVARRQRVPAYDGYSPRDGKENHMVAESPAKPPACHDTPTKKLTRSPKPLTLLPSAYGANGGDDTRRSSPGLFKAPVGAAHHAVRHRQQQNNMDALQNFRERMRAGGGAPAQLSARERETTYERQQEPARPQSARRQQHAAAQQGPRDPSPRTHAAAMAGHYGAQYNNAHGHGQGRTRSVSPRHSDAHRHDQHGVREGPHAAQPAPPPSRHGADFRQRKYASGRVTALLR